MHCILKGHLCSVYSLPSKDAVKCFHVYCINISKHEDPKFILYILLCFFLKRIPM